MPTRVTLNRTCGDPNRPHQPRLRFKHAILSGLELSPPHSFTTHVFRESSFLFLSLSTIFNLTGVHLSIVCLSLVHTTFPPSRVLSVCSLTKPALHCSRKTGTGEALHTSRHKCSCNHSSYLGMRGLSWLDKP